MAGFGPTSPTDRLGCIAGLKHLPPATLSARLPPSRLRLFGRNLMKLSSWRPRHRESSRSSAPYPAGQLDVA
jgi:hypothetical protein